MDKNAKTAGGHTVNKRRSLQQYRALDLVMWCAMLLVFESVIIIASNRWFPGQPYTVSLVPAIVAIVMVRWGSWAAAHAVLGGAVLCGLLGAGPSQYAIYCGGNLCALALLPVLARHREKGMFPGGFLAVMGYALAAALLMQAGRALLSLLFGGDGQTALACFTTEVVTDLITLLILWVASRLDGVLEDQPHYVRRIAKEENN